MGERRGIISHIQVLIDWSTVHCGFSFIYTIEDIHHSNYRPEVLSLGDLSNLRRISNYTEG